MKNVLTVPGVVSDSFCEQKTGKKRRKKKKKKKREGNERVCALGVIAIFHGFTWYHLDKIQKAFCSNLPHTHTESLI